jgi:hypothetical protein
MRNTSKHTYLGSSSSRLYLDTEPTRLLLLVVILLVLPQVRGAVDAHLGIHLVATQVKIPFPSESIHDDQIHRLRILFHPLTNRK